MGSRFARSAERCIRAITAQRSVVPCPQFPTSPFDRHSGDGPRRPLPHHRAYGSVHGGSSRLREHPSIKLGRPRDLK